MSTESFVPLVQELHDIEEFASAELLSLVDAQASIVEFIASDAPLDETLLAVARALEGVWPDSRVAFHMTVEETHKAVMAAPTLTSELRNALTTIPSAVLLERVDPSDPFTPVQLDSAAPPKADWSDFAHALRHAQMPAAWFSLVTPVGDPTPSWMVVFVSSSEVLSDGKQALVRRFAQLSRVAIDQQRRELRLHRLIADERQRIAGVIHDDPIQALTAVGLRIQRLARHVEGNAAEQVAELHLAVGTAIERMRRLLVDLHPPTLDDDGLVSAIDVYLSEVLEPLGIECTLHEVVDEEPALGTASLAYRLTVEALWNVVKHADATQVDVGVTIEAGTVEIRIADNGKGFDSSKAKRRRAGHMGISACRELALRASGTWKVESNIGAGTVVTLWLPGAAPIDATEQIPSASAPEIDEEIANGEPR
jgi:signal transduction histidine kinase